MFTEDEPSITVTLTRVEAECVALQISAPYRLYHPDPVLESALTKLLAEHGRHYTTCSERAGDYLTPRMASR